MQVFHTDGVPPSNGSNSFPNMGCTENNNNALRKSVTAKVIVVNKVLCLAVMLSFTMVESIMFVLLRSEDLIISVS